MTKRRDLAVGLLILVILSGTVLGQSRPKTVHVTLNPAQQSGIVPTSMALFSYTNREGILVWEAGVPAVPPIRNGRVFIDQQGETRTAVAFSAGFTPATLSIELHDQDGVSIGSLTRELRAQEKIALFADELFEDIPGNFVGSLTFSVSPDAVSGVGALTLRGGLNTKGEPVFATLKVADLDQPLNSTTQVLPQVGGAPGFSTQIVLINPSNQPLAGKIRLLNSSGPFELELAGQFLSEIAFSLSPRGVRRFDLSRSTGIGVGYAVVSTESGPFAPVASAIFQYRDSEQPDPEKNLLSEAGVLANPPTTGALLYVDTRRSRSGVAISNHMNDGVAIDLTLVKADGSEVQVTRNLEPSGHLAVFVDELFPNLDSRDVLLKVSSPVPIFLTPLKLTINQRQHPILATLPYLDMEQTELGLHLLPQVAFGAGLRTEIIHLVPPTTASSPQQSNQQELCWYLDFLDPETGYSLVNLEQSLSAGFQVCSPPGSGLLLEPVAPGVEVPLAGERGPLIEIEPELFPATHGCCDTSHRGVISILDDCPSGCDGSVAEGDSGMHTGSGVGVYLHSGELYLTETDLEIPGRGFNWKFERKYRSGGFAEGPLGHSWEFNYNRRLAVVGDKVFSYFITLAEPGDVIRMDGLTRADVYKLQPDGSFRSPTGFFTRLWSQPDGTYVERDSRGIRTLYGPLDARGIARMISMSDSDGNTMQFRHDSAGRLVEVIDTFGRSIRYRYNTAGQLAAVVDFSGRTVSFVYNLDGDLIRVTTPAVTGTPNGNDFPMGKTTRYTYSTQEGLTHNLVSITAPNEVATGGPARVIIAYDSEDRVTALTIGGTNSSGVPAGGTIRYEYRNPTDSSAVAQTDVTDRNGNLTEYSFNALGNVILKREFTNRDLRPGDPTRYETRYEYNADGNRTREVLPLGNSIQYTYDEQNFDRLQHGNLLSWTSRPDPSRSGDQQFLRETLSYEPIYNQVRRRTGPRGNDPDHAPQNGGARTPERYSTIHTLDYQEGNDLPGLAEATGLTTAEVSDLLSRAGIPMNLGDLNGDGSSSQVGGHVIRTEYPTVELLLPSLVAQPGDGSTSQAISETHIFNRFGQVISSTDPEGTSTIFDYFPENDPDGDGRHKIPGRSSQSGGLLKSIELDPITASRDLPGEPLAIRNLYFYDEIGNVVREVDGRGISTEYGVNTLNQTVEIRRAARQGAFDPFPKEPQDLPAFGFIQRFFYDFNDNIVFTQVEDRGNTSDLDGNLPAQVLPPMVVNPDPKGGAAFADTVTQYDILDNPVEVIAEQRSGSASFLRNRFRYDPNENRVLVIQPEGNAGTTVFDERDLPLHETLGAPFPPELVHLSADDPLNYLVRGGVPSTVHYVYDGNRNLIELADAEDTDHSEQNNSTAIGNGDRTRFIFDGFDRLTGAVGPTGTQTVTQYDAASNVVRELAFGSTGGPSPVTDGPDRLPGPVSVRGVVQSGNLISMNLLSGTERLYDELGRFFQVDRLLFVNTIDLDRSPDLADGASDIGKGDLTPGDNHAIPGLSSPAILGRVSSRFEFDRNSRVAYHLEDDGDIFRFTYDPADRLTLKEDPEGNRKEYAYDANGNVIETRETDVSQIAEIVDEQFLTTLFYDSLDRLTRQVDNLGNALDFRYDSRDNLVASADSRGPLGGTISRRSFQPGARTVNQINRFGNVRRYYYDGIGRKVADEIILTSEGEGDGVHIGADIFGIKGTTPSPDQDQGGGDGRILTAYQWTPNGLLARRTDDNGNQTQFTYDDLNRLVTRTEGVCSADSLTDSCSPPTTTFFSYDQDHNITQTIDANGSIILNTHDASNRLIKSQVLQGQGVTGTTLETFEYDGLSRVVLTTDNNEPADPEDDGFVRRAYDSMGRIIEETQTLGERNEAPVSSNWRAANLRTALVYPSGRTVRTRYDRLDRVQTVQDDSSATSLVEYAYGGKTQLLERRYPPNGTRQTMLDNSGMALSGYDGLRRPVLLRHLTQDNQLLLGFENSYDRMGNRTSERKLHDLANSEEYQYDSASRLRRFDRPAPEGADQLYSSWKFDGVGNWLQVDDEVRTHSSSNEVIQRQTGSSLTTLSSDSNGNVSDDGEYQLSWDFRDRLRSVMRKSDKSEVAKYSYDALGRRLQKEVFDAEGGRSLTLFTHDGWSILEEANGLGKVQVEYLQGTQLDQPLIAFPGVNQPDGSGGGSNLSFFHQNTLGSIFGVTDRTGSLEQRFQYEPYGARYAQTSVSESPFGLGGGRLDAETGFYYFRNRFLHPDLGRFLSRDPIDSASLGSSLYTYADSQPVDLTDPLGLFTIHIGPSGELSAGVSGKVEGGIVIEFFSARSWFDFGFYVSGGVGARSNASASATLGGGGMSGAIEDFEGAGLSAGLSGGEGPVVGVDLLKSDTGHWGFNLSGGIGAGLAPVDVGVHRTMTESFTFRRDLLPKGFPGHVSKTDTKSPVPTPERAAVLRGERVRDSASGRFFHPAELAFDRAARNLAKKTEEFNRIETAFKNLSPSPARREIMRQRGVIPTDLFDLSPSYLRSPRDQTGKLLEPRYVEEFRQAHVEFVIAHHRYIQYITSRLWNRCR